MFRPFTVIRAVLVAAVFVGMAGTAAVRLDIIRDEPLICDYLPWWPGCDSGGDTGGGGSGAGEYPN